ncbi:MAG: replication-associated recombination protein A, partial [Sphingomonas sp.]
YAYDHDHPDAFSGQEFFPDEIAASNPEPLYAPNERGFERDIRKRLAYWSAKRDAGR